MTEHISKQYDQDLETIRSRMMQMGGLVESQARAAIDGYMNGDLARIDAVIANDKRANELEVAIDNDLGQIIVRRQPAASDLRLILAVSKTVTDLERVGDEAAKIARMAREIHTGRGVAGIPLTAVGHVSEIAIGMLRRSLDAFARLDAAAAARVCAEDVAIDTEFRSIIRQLITFMMEDPRTISTSLNIVWVAKAFERIGDHSKNIAEHVIYIVKGRDVRHIPLAELEREALGLMGADILVVEDEPSIQALIAASLRKSGYQVRSAINVEEAYRALSAALPDVVLLDWMLPDGNGPAITKKLRSEARTKEVPIIMLTARAGDDDKVEGLASGADDYVTKPFSPRELDARIQAVLRRRAPQLTLEMVEIQGLSLNPATRTVKGGKTTLKMGPTEFELLHFFMTHPERVYSRAQILDHVWGDHVFIEDRTVDVHIRRLRDALSPSGHDKLVETARGAGYLFRSAP